MRESSVGRAKAEEVRSQALVKRLEFLASGISEARTVEAEVITAEQWPSRTLNCDTTHQFAPVAVSRRTAKPSCPLVLYWRMRADLLVRYSKCMNSSRHFQR